ncbi:Nn.00g113420.m01.CDS01 [Neocucurbitaria sp. VM-36]
MSASQTIRIFSISTALLASGAIATLTLFDVPLLKSQPASRSLPMTRWLFSRGSHIFPTAAFLSSSGFAYLAYSALPSGMRTISTVFQHATKGQPGLYLAAAALTISIAPFTALMIPTNFSLIKINEEKGGSRSAASAEYRESKGLKTRSAEESTDSKDDISQWKDLSVPQEKTTKESTSSEDEEVKRLLEKFGQLNGGRAILMGLGGVVGLMGALA